MKCLTEYSTTFIYLVVCEPNELDSLTKVKGSSKLSSRIPEDEDTLLSSLFEDIRKEDGSSLSSLFSFDFGIFSSQNNSKQLIKLVKDV